MSNNEQPAEDNVVSTDPEEETADATTVEPKEQEEQSGAEEKEDQNDEDEKEGGDDVIARNFRSQELSLRSTLHSIKVESPELKEPKIEFDPDLYPPSYHDNNAKERKAIVYCKRFLNHFNHLYDKPRPLFVKPKNEFGVKKLVCTTIHPTQLPYKDLLDWPDIARYMATHLVYKKLSSPMDLPETLFAPQTVLSQRSGHCFEFSTLLCSMLIGSGYDAYVVSGYATRELANLDCSYTDCPLIEPDVTVYPNPITLTIKRYTVRPPRWNRSEYLRRMKKKKEAVIQIEADTRAKIKEIEREMDEAPPEDVMFGWRIHSWVLVLKGHRDVLESFFIEPTRGVAFPLNWDGYLRVDSLWNHYNYYTNAQETEPNDISSLRFDIGNSCDWEYVFPGQDLHVTKTSSEMAILDRKIILEGDKIEEEIPLDLPFTWTLPLTLSRENYDLRYPTGKTSRRYKRSEVDLYAEYMHPDGLVKTLSVYFDLDCHKLYYTRNYYAHRSDLMYETFTHYPSGKIFEYFLDGRADFIKEHQYYIQTPGPETPRNLVFFNNRRTDALYRREESPTFLKEWYDDRPDRKLYRETTFGPEGSLFERGIWPEARPIAALVEEFSRDPSVPANEDIGRVTFTVHTDEIDVEYHVEEEKLYGSTRHFTKPERWWDEGLYLDWKPELHWNFEADVYAIHLCELTLFQMMVKFMDKEAKSRVLTRKSEKETKILLEKRAGDLSKLQLLRTYVDADIIPANRIARLEEKARLKAEYLLKKSDILKDFLEPYLHRFGLNKVTNKKQAVRVMENLMSDLKDRLVFNVDLIKTSYEKLKDDVIMMQMVHNYQFSKLSKDEMEEYKDELTLKLFMGHILGQRLIAFKNDAPIKYRGLYEQMRADPRMAPFL